MTDTDGVDLIREQWRRERPELDTAPIGVIGRISRLAREIELRLEPVYADCGLEPGWYDVLATLRRAGPPYRLRPTDFAASLMLTSSGTTKRLDRLEAAGHVTREPDPADRRGVLIALTDRGRALVDQAAGRHLANEKHILGGLTAAERRELASLLRKLGTTLPPPGEPRLRRPAGAGRRLVINGSRNRITARRLAWAARSRPAVLAQLAPARPAPGPARSAPARSGEQARAHSRPAAASFLRQLTDVLP